MTYRDITKLASASAALALAVSLAPNAQAKIVTATYTGTVSSGYDITGIFGAPSTDLGGDTFRAVYTINDAYGDTNIIPGVYSYAVGGSYFGNASPVSATVSVAGRSISMGGSYYGLDQQVSGSVYNDPSVEHVVQESNYDPSAEIQTFMETYIEKPAGSSLFGSDFHDPLSYTVQPNDYVGGTLSIQTYQNGAQTGYAYASLSPTEVTIGAPEPGAWALMLVGVGAVGASGRRRRTALA